jgi:hypothetical protein
MKNTHGNTGERILFMVPQLSPCTATTEAEDNIGNRIHELSSTFHSIKRRSLTELLSTSNKFKISYIFYILFIYEGGMRALKLTKNASIYSDDLLHPSFVYFFVKETNVVMRITVRLNLAV